VQGMQAMSFEASYRCYSVAMKGKENLENGGKSTSYKLCQLLFLLLAVDCE